MRDMLTREVVEEMLVWSAESGYGDHVDGFDTLCHMALLTVPKPFYAVDHVSWPKKADKHQFFIIYRGGYRTPSISTFWYSDEGTLEQQRLYAKIMWHDLGVKAYLPVPERKEIL